MAKSFEMAKMKVKFMQKQRNQKMCALSDVCFFTLIHEHMIFAMVWVFCPKFKKIFSYYISCMQINY